VFGYWFKRIPKDERYTPFTMEVIDFVPGETLRKDRWKVCLTDPDGTQQFFLMNFNAMKTYLLPSQADGSATPGPSSSVQPPVQHTVNLPSDLPSVDALYTAQRKDMTFQFWFDWLSVQQLQPSSASPSYRWWLADRDQVFLDSNNLLCRLANIHSATQSRPTVQIIVPADIVPKVLHFVHGSEQYSHQGFSRALYTLLQQFYWPRMRDNLLNRVKACTCSEHNSY